MESLVAEGGRLESNRLHIIENCRSVALTLAEAGRREMVHVYTPKG